MSEENVRAGLEIFVNEGCCFAVSFRGHRSKCSNGWAESWNKIWIIDGQCRTSCWRTLRAVSEIDHKSFRPLSHWGPPCGRIGFLAELSVVRLPIAYCLYTWWQLSTDDEDARRDRLRRDDRQSSWYVRSQWEWLRLWRGDSQTACLGLSWYGEERQNERSSRSWVRERLSRLWCLWLELLQASERTDQQRWGSSRSRLKEVKDRLNRCGCVRSVGLVEWKFRSGLRRAGWFCFSDSQYSVWRNAWYPDRCLATRMSVSQDAR